MEQYKPNHVMNYNLRKTLVATRRSLALNGQNENPNRI
jgi:hypothetical protein